MQLLKTMALSLPATLGLYAALSSSAAHEFCTSLLAYEHFPVFLAPTLPSFPHWQKQPNVEVSHHLTTHAQLEMNITQIALGNPLKATWCGKLHLAVPMS